MTGRWGNARLFWAAAAVVLALDVWSKRWVVHHLIPHVPRPVVGDAVRMTLAYNPGAAFSMWLGPHSRIIFGLFAVVALGVLWRIYRQSQRGDWVRVLALGLAWGGAAGNLIDRFTRGSLGVVDFIDIGVGRTRFWTFNVADSAVTVGAVTLALVLWREERAEQAAQAADAAVAAAAPSPADQQVQSDSAVPGA